MTEYDYSPAAWEHYRAQQARVSNWVSQTTAQAHSYSNPFVMSPTLRDRSFYDEPSGRRQRPAPSRSKTFDMSPPRHEDPYRHTSSRSRSASHSQPIDMWSYPHSSRTDIQTASHSRSSSARKPPSRSHTVQVMYPPPAAPTHQYQRTQPYPYPQKQSQPVRQHTSPAYYYPEQSHGHGSHQRTTYHQPSRPVHTYHAPNGRLEYHYGPPAQKKPQPLFKRLLGFMSPGSGNGRGGPVNHRSSGRRSSY
ncbi:uncharacterized protein EDB93DRAFT_1132324 [Suillus bovinus]|uniref:uncharacterized protein n=1 Tax=Suillus bovinus TaxID=48563 RepID=UPI001B873E61|nr:uncharacterized protein EDB93DRAFT_1132324 [Suillus bovinus]KAG2154445.1 hypothetical protein EDB93DRAFT_1132324 [Suillus bovinus]